MVKYKLVATYLFMLMNFINEGTKSKILNVYMLRVEFKNR